MAKTRSNFKSKVTSINISGDVSSSTIRVGDTTGYTSEEVSKLIAKISSTFQPKPFNGQCPYKGLDFFEEEDAELFFGRENLVEDLVSRVKDSWTVFITGPSGSGKSSLVRAGLIHALKQGALKGSKLWQYATMKPGRDPIEALALTFSRLKSPELGNYFRQNVNDPSTLNECAESVLNDNKNQRLILFIDQFEEIFTQVSHEEERMTFLNLLTYSANMENGRIIILFAMRSDFVSSCAVYPELNATLNRQFIQIGAMQPDELVSAIAQPALRVGLKIDPDLIAQIINDMKGEPGALPLMSFALKDLFDAMQSKGGLIQLNLNDYLQRGGIQKALERHADAAFESLGKSEQELARFIFSGLIEIGRGTQDTKRTAIFNELVPANVNAETVEAIIRKLADARLVTTDEQTVTISHEKLIDAWTWLRKLVNENREVIALQNEITSAAKEWEEHKRDSSYLYSGGRLANIWEEAQKKKLVLGHLAQEFVKLGRKRQQRTKVGIVSAVSIVLITAIIASVEFQKQAQTNIEIANTAQAASAFAIEQQNIAQANEQEAKRQGGVALARQLAAQAQSLSKLEPKQQIVWGLLGVESMKILPSFEASQVFQGVTLPSHIVSYPYDVASLTFSPDGNSLAGNSDSTIYVWDVETGSEISHIELQGFKTLSKPIFSPDGIYLSTIGCQQEDISVGHCSDGDAVLWNLKTKQEIFRIIYPVSISSVTFSQDGRLGAFGGCNNLTSDKKCEAGLIRIWDLTTQKEILDIHPNNSISALAFDPTGTFLVTNSSEGLMQTWSIADGKEVNHVFIGDQTNSISFCNDGKRVISISLGKIHIWEALVGEEEVVIPYNISAAGAVAISPDCALVADGDDYSGVSKVHYVDSGDVIANLTTNDQAYSLVFSPTGRYLARVGLQSIRIWDSYTWQEIVHIEYDNNPNLAVFAFSPDELLWVSSTITPSNSDPLQDEGGTLELWEVRTGALVARLGHDRNYSIEIAKDMSLAATGGRNELLGVWDVDTGKELLHIGLEDKSLFPNYTDSVDITSDTRYAVSGGTDGTAHILDISTGREISHVNHNSLVDYVRFSANGKFVVSTSIYDKVLVSETITGKTMYEATAKIAIVSPDRRWLAVLDSDGTLLLLDLLAPSTKPLSLRTGLSIYENFQPYSVSFSPTSQWLVITGPENSAEAWHILSSNNVAHTTFDEISNQYFVTFCRDDIHAVFKSAENVFEIVDVRSKIITGRVVVEKDLLASIDSDCKYVISSKSTMLSVLDIAKNVEISQMNHENAVTAYAVSPDAKYIASSGSCDSRSGMSETICPIGTLKIWEIGTGKEIARLPIDDAVYSLNFSSDGKFITASVGGATHIWIWRPEDLIADICSRLPRNLTRAEWKQYIGDALSYQAVCPNLPIEPEEAPIPTTTSTP